MIKVRGAKKIYWCDFMTSSGERVRHSLHTTDRKEALALEAKERLEAGEKAKARRKGGLTLKEAFTHAMRVRDSWRSAKSIHSINQVYGMVAHHFGEDCYLSELDDECLLEYGEELFDNGLTPSTINKRFSLVAVLFDEAIQWKKYQGRKPNTVRYKVKNGRKRLISTAEEAKVISILRESKSPCEQAMADLVIVLAETGLWLSEGLNIEYRDVNLQHRTLIVPETRNDEARAVPLTERALEVLNRRSNNSPMFHPLTRSMAPQIWRRVRAKMGLEHDKEFVLHSFRRTLASALANAGIDAFLLQRLMGHKSLATTQRSVQLSTQSVKGIVQIIEERNSKIPSPL